MDRRNLIALFAALVPLTHAPGTASARVPAAHVEETEEETLNLDPYGAKVIAIDHRKKRVIIEGDLTGLRILVTDELGNLVFPKWKYVVEEGRVIITFSSPDGWAYEGKIYLGFIDFRGQSRKVNLTWA